MDDRYASKWIRNYIGEYDNWLNSWGFKIGSMDCDSGGGFELWDIGLNRVCAARWILSEQLHALHRTEDKLELLCKTVKEALAEAMFERAVFKKYKKPSWELDAKGIEIEL